MNKILDMMLKYKIICEEEVDNYRYALNVIGFKLMHYSIFLSIGFYLNYYIETIIFLYVYTFSRTYLEGFHAKRPSTCIMLSFLFIFVLNLINSYNNFNRNIMIVLLICLLYCIYQMCPKPTFKYNLLKHLIFVEIMSICFFVNNNNTYLLFVCYALLITILLHIINKIHFQV